MEWYGYSRAWGEFPYELYYQGHVFELEGDTIVNDLSYTKVALSFNWSYSTFSGLLNTNDYYEGVIGGIREDSTKKVWFINFVDMELLYWYECIPPASVNSSSPPFPIGEETILYDFDLEVGDTVHWKTTDLGTSNIISEIDQYTLANGSVRTRYIFQTNESPPPDFWVEGLGSNLGLFGAYLYTPFEGACHMYCAVENEASLINSDMPDFYESLFLGCDILKPVSVDHLNTREEIVENVFPNPTEGVVQIDLGKSHPELEVGVYNCYGKLLSQQFLANQQNLIISLDGPAGVYVISLETGQAKHGVRVVKF